MLSILRRLRGRKRKAAKIEVILDGDARARQLPYWSDRKNTPRFYLPVDQLVSKGAHNFGSAGHPFRRALSGGSSDLAHFYRELSPANIRELYRIRPSGEKGEDLPPWEMPWLLGKRSPPMGERGLDARHGVGAYGPCTAQKVELEIARLGRVLASVRRNGYQPDLYGDIVGHFLRRGNEYRFFVRGGKHRAAVLAHLGNGTIPVCFADDWPRVVHDHDADQWPLVAGGDMSRKLALDIFNRYFDHRAPSESGSRFRDRNTRKVESPERL